VNDEQPSVDRSESPDLEPGFSRTLGLFIPVFTLAALVRAIPWQYVLTRDGVIFRDGDSYSHMWRIWNAASKSIPLSARDPFVNFQTAARSSGLRHSIGFLRCWSVGSA
jgi:hypothetical protein